MTDPLVEEFQQARGAYHLAQLIGALKEIQDKDPTFALSACADAVLAVEALIKGQSNAEPTDVERVCSTLAVALYNGFTNHKATIVYEDYR